MRGATPTYAAIEALLFVIDPLFFKGLVPGLIFVWCLFGSRWQALSSGPPVEMTALLVVYTKGEGVRAATRGEGIRAATRGRR